MVKYVITNSMKRHERANLCLKVFNDMVDCHKLYYLSKPLGKIIESKLKSQNKFRPSKEPIFAITSSTYRGLPFYIFLDRTQTVQVVFNTSPIDASYVEFIKILNLPNNKTMVFTQHALDRYNERVHGRKYDNYKDIMKRFMVNNPMVNSNIVHNGHKITSRVAEGFLSGTRDTTHHMMIMNTFFDKLDEEDNKSQHYSRSYFDSLSALSPDLRDFFKNLEYEKAKGNITHEEMIVQLQLRYLQLIEEGMKKGLL